MEFTHEQLQCIELGVILCYDFFLFGAFGGFFGYGLWKIAYKLVDWWERRKKQ